MGLVSLKEWTKQNLSLIRFKMIAAYPWVWIYWYCLHLTKDELRWASFNFEQTIRTLSIEKIRVKSKPSFIKSEFELILL